jgi:hypothetical protein
MRASPDRTGGVVGADGAAGAGTGGETAWALLEPNAAEALGEKLPVLVVAGGGTAIRGAAVSVRFGGSAAASAAVSR